MIDGIGSDFCYILSMPISIIQLHRQISLIANHQIISILFSCKRLDCIEITCFSFIVGMRIVYFVILSIPVEASLSTSLRITIECWFYYVLTIECIEIHEVMRMGKRHGDVAKMIEHGLKCLTPFRGGSCGPSA